MSSSDATLNEKVDFEVLEDVKIGDAVVIQHGGMAIATVTEAQPKRRMGKAGKLNMNIDYVQLVSGEKVPLRAVKGGVGGNHTAAMTGAIVATSIIFFPAAPFFLFMHGKDITIPKGTEITAYVAADTALDSAKFAKQPAATANSQPSTEAAATSDFATAAIKSSPDGADITIDGNFVGTTPSNLQLKAGEHSIVIEKSGFKPWQRTMTVTAGGTANLEVTLEKIPSVVTNSTSRDEKNAWR
jgi:acetyltransferase-like isoleucine patch superfamily enzyme